MYLIKFKANKLINYINLYPLYPHSIVIEIDFAYLNLEINIIVSAIHKLYPLYIYLMDWQSFLFK